MPSIDQCEGASPLTALPSTLEIFDTFKPPPENGNKHSDSEESFHLLLDDDDAENGAAGSHNGETEDDILNKFDTEDTEMKGATVIQVSARDEKYVNSPQGEFKSLYEDEVEPDRMEVNGDPTFEDSMGTEGDNDNQIASLIDTLEQEEEETEQENPPSPVENGENVENPQKEEVVQKEEEQESPKEEINDEAMEQDVPSQDETSEAPKENEPPEMVMPEEQEEPAQEEPPADETEQLKEASDDPLDVSNEENDSKDQEEEMIVEEAESATEDSIVEEPSKTTTENPSPTSDEDPSASASGDIPAETPQDPTSEAPSPSPSVETPCHIPEEDPTPTSDAPSTEISPHIPEEDPTPTSETPSLSPSAETPSHIPEEDPTPTSEAPSTEISSHIPEDEPTPTSEAPSPSPSAETPFQIREEDPTPTADAPSTEITSHIQEDDPTPTCEAPSPSPSVEPPSHISEEDPTPTSDASTSSSPPKEDEDPCSSTSTEAPIFKVPEEIPKEDDKSNDKTEDESDLLDITMVRETEEDDACAMADAITDMETRTSEKSDEDRMDEDFDDNAMDGTDEDSDQAKRVVGEEKAAVVEEEEEKSVDVDAEVVEKEKSEEECDKVVINGDVEEKEDKTDDKVLEEEEGAKQEVVEVLPSEEEEEEEVKKETEEKTVLENCPPAAPKRPLPSEPEPDPVTPKKPKYEHSEPAPESKVKVLTDFGKFMQCRKLAAKLSRSDLEQFCIQKICESLVLKSTEGELHQQIKNQEKIIEGLRKDLSQLSKQCKDLDIVNRKLMNEIRNPNAPKRPLVPLKITRSVGLQVRLNPGAAPGDSLQIRNKRPAAAPAAATTPQKQLAPSPVANSNNNRKVGAPAQSGGSVAQSSPVVRQVLNSPQRSPLTTAATTTTPNSLLGQALQTQKRTTPAILSKRTPNTPSPTNATRKSAAGVIVDLTDEDDRLKSVTNTIKLVSRGQGATPGNNKGAGAKTPSPSVKTNVIQGKSPMAVNKTVAGKQNALPQGIRLAQAIQTSSANGSPQMVYVVPTITNAGGQQKVAFVNFQPTMAGQTMSVLSNNKSASPGITLKPVTAGGGGMTSSPRYQKHPAPLPAVRTPLDPKLKPLLPKPHLTIKRIDTGIILQWKMPYNLDQYESIASYQLYAYQETSAPPSTDMWRKVGDVKALALPMACTLTQFADKNKYYFAVRSVDVHKRIGAFSDPEEISL